MDIEPNRLTRRRLNKVLKLLGKYKGRVFAVVFVMLEVISLVFDLLRKSKLIFVLTSFIFSALGFAMTVFICINERTRSRAERQLGVIEFAFSVVQLVTTCTHYFLARAGIKENYTTVSLFPFVFSFVVVFFNFRKDRVNDSSDPASSTLLVTVDDSSDPASSNLLVEVDDSSEPASSNLLVEVDDSSEPASSTSEPASSNLLVEVDDSSEPASSNLLVEVDDSSEPASSNLLVTVDDSSEPASSAITFRESVIADQVNRRAREVARLRELHTLKGRVESVLKLKGLDIDTILQHNSV